jgi:hypothetical protein
MRVEQEKSDLGGIKVRFVRYRSEWRCLARGAALVWGNKMA